MRALKFAIVKILLFAAIALQSQAQETINTGSPPLWGLPDIPMFVTITCRIWKLIMIFMQPCLFAMQRENGFTKRIFRRNTKIMICTMDIK